MPAAINVGSAVWGSPEPGFEPGPSPWKADEPQYAQKGAGHMPAPHISANRLPALVGNLSLALAEPEAKTADQRTKGGHAGGHNRGVAGLGKHGAGLPGSTVGPVMLPRIHCGARHAARRHDPDRQPGPDRRPAPDPPDPIAHYPAHFPGPGPQGIQGWGHQEP